MTGKTRLAWNHVLAANPRRRVTGHVAQLGQGGGIVLLLEERHTREGGKLNRQNRQIDVEGCAVLW